MHPHERRACRSQLTKSVGLEKSCLPRSSSPSEWPFSELTLMVKNAASSAGFGASAIAALRPVRRILGGRRGPPA
jgi:hypothetical protein